MRAPAKAVYASATALALLVAACSADTAQVDEPVNNENASTNEEPQSLSELLEEDPNALVLPSEGGLLAPVEASDPVASRLEELGIRDDDAQSSGLAVVRDTLLMNPDATSYLRPVRGQECPILALGQKAEVVTIDFEGWVFVSDSPQSSTTAQKVSAGDTLCTITATDEELPEADPQALVVPSAAKFIATDVTSLEDCYDILSQFPSVRWTTPLFFQYPSPECYVTGYNLTAESAAKIAEFGLFDSAEPVVFQSTQESDGAAPVQVFDQMISESFARSTAQMLTYDPETNSTWVGGEDISPPRPAGAGVRVYIVDNGINYIHPAFRGRVEKGVGIGGPYPRPGPSPSSPAAYIGGAWDNCTGHGTGVAGFAAGTDIGFATSATIIPVRVQTSGPRSCNDGSLDVRAGLRWVLDDVLRIKNETGQVPLFVVNVSTGISDVSEKYNEFLEDFLEPLSDRFSGGSQSQLTQELRNWGGILAKSAGNDHSNGCDAGSPLGNRWGNQGNSIIVGALDAYETQAAGRTLASVAERRAIPATPPQWSETDWLSEYNNASGRPTGPREYYWPKGGPSMASVSEYSNFGGCLDVWAQGRGYSASAFYDNPLTPGAPEFSPVAGTSFSAPLVAGAAAVWLEKFGQAGSRENRDRFRAAVQTTGILLPYLLTNDNFTVDQVQALIDESGDSGWKDQVALWFPALMQVSDAVGNPQDPCRGLPECDELDAVYLTNESVPDRIGIVRANEEVCGEVAPGERAPTECGVTVRIASTVFADIRNFTLPQFTTPVKYVGVVDVFDTGGSRRQLAFDTDGYARGRYVQIVDFVDGEFLSVTPPQSEEPTHQPLPASESHLTVWGNWLGYTYGTFFTHGADASSVVTQCEYILVLDGEDELFETEIKDFGVADNRWAIKDERSGTYLQEDLPSGCTGGFFE